MTDRYTIAIDTEHDRSRLIAWASGAHLGKWQVVIQTKKRSLNQNDLAFKWYQEIAAQKGDETPTEIRAFCKLHFGVEIRRKDMAFRDKYDEILKPLPIPMKLALMVEPFDLPVTRDMTKAEMTTYLDAMQGYWTGRGIQLTMPEAA